MVKSGYVCQSEHGQLWRVSARVEALSQIDYGRFIDELRVRIAPPLAHYNERFGGGIKATCTGMVPLVYKAQRMLLEDLIKSFLLAFLRTRWLATVRSAFPA